MTTLQSRDSRTGQPVGPAWPESTAEQIDEAVARAAAAAEAFATTTAQQRALLLRGLAAALVADRGALVALADQETALGLPRLEGEVDRTAFQLRAFADAVEQGAAQAVVDDAAVPGPPPAGRPHLLRVRVPLGPVAVFAASNFPFAFSVLGGDTASALAAGCPVVLKAHPAHPALSRCVAASAQAVLLAQGLPEGVFQYVEGGSVSTGVRLVQADAIAAVAFTGSFQGGMALSRAAAERPRPIPFYGELGSINPLVVLPAALDRGLGAEAVSLLAGSIGQGSGQFCTRPGVIVVPQGQAGDSFARALAHAVQALSPHAMLTAGMRSAFDRGVAGWRASATVQPLTEGRGAASPSPQPCLAEVRAGDFIAQAELQQEVFGPAALVVRSAAPTETVAVLNAIGGALTATLWGAEEECDANRAIVRAATRMAGRVLFSGVPTGVAVTAAQQHGGPFPASTAPMTTSVGAAALDRFLRPVALQSAPAWLLNRHGLPC